MKIVNKQFPEKERSAKQCRERYMNYSSLLIEGQKKSQWRKEDIEDLFSSFIKFGTKWAIIIRKFPGKELFLLLRSENEIKNKFYGLLRKALRKINSAGKNMRKKIKKNIRYESLIRIIEAPECFQNLSEDLKEQSVILRDKFLDFMMCPDKKVSSDEIVLLIQQINRFNLATRSHRSKKEKANCLKTVCEEDLMINNHQIKKAPEMIHEKIPIELQCATPNTNNNVFLLDDTFLFDICNKQNMLESTKTSENEWCKTIEEIHVCTPKHERIELFDFLLNDSDKVPQPFEEDI